MSDADEQALTAFVGQVFDGRYRIDALLGMGGMGGLFRARHLGLGRDVAIKVLRPAMRSGHIAPARFEREARSASRLDHPSCVRVDDFGELPDGSKFLVMELVVGDELKTRLGAPWDPREAIALTLQILDGLAHAHARGIVHRDLKPENVLLTRDHGGARSIKLIDFGIAKIVEGDDAEPKLTRAGMLFGTPRYMSPEQAGGGKIDARTDLYAVGLLLYEMLAGRAPFDGADASSVMRMHVLTPPPPLPDTVSPALAEVVMRLLAKSRSDRYADAHETIAALERVRAEPTVPPLASTSQPWQPPASALVTAWPRVEPPPRSGPTRNQLVAIAVVFVLFWIAVLAVWLWPSSAPPPASTPTVASTPTPAPAPVVAEVAPPQPFPGIALRSCAGERCECDDHEPCDLACTRDCELECEGGNTCHFACGDDCWAKCGGHTECMLDVGPRSEVKCDGKSSCTITCRGDCRVDCKGKTECAVRCADGSAPVECGKDTTVCGSCR